MAKQREAGRPRKTTAFIHVEGEPDIFGNYSIPVKTVAREVDMNSSEGNNGDPLIPLKQATITQVELLNPSLVVVSFSNGNAISVDAEKVRTLALTSGTEYASP